MIRARNGLVPQLSLDYNSNAGHSTLGPGWDLPLDHVRRSVRHGTPRYIGPAGVPSQDDELEFRLEGDSGTLVYCGVENNLHLYRPKLEGAFAKFYYQTSGDFWIVQNTSGRTWYLGETGAKDGSGSQTFAWYVRRVVDQYQNMIRFTYGAEHGNLYLERVDYDLKETSDPPNHPYVTLNYDVPTDPLASISYRKGFRAELDGRSLISIQVHAFSETGAPGVRTYNIRQEPLFPGGQRTITEVNPDVLPTASFAYHGVTASMNVGRDIVIPASADHVLTRSLEVTCAKRVSPYMQYRTQSMLADVDGDGDLDQLLYYQGAYRWRKNVGWALDDQLRPVTIASPGEPEALKYSVTDGTETSLVHQDILDMDGDGKVDFVKVDSIGSIIVCRGDGQGNFGVVTCDDWMGSPGMASQYKLARTVTELSGIHHLDDVALLDVNGDGLPDYLLPAEGTNTAPGQFLAYLNRGIRPNGTVAGFDASPLQIGLCYCHASTLRSCLRWHMTGSQAGSMFVDLRDVNGDGLLDKLFASELDPSASHVTPGRGPFLLGPDGAYFDQSGRYTNATNLIQESQFLGDPMTVLTNAQIAGLYDVNGDGMLDVLRWDQSGYHMHANQGVGFGTATPYPVASGLLSGLSRVEINATSGVIPGCDVVTMLRQNMIDFDGDGRLELVRGSEDARLGQPLTWRAATMPPVDGPAYSMKQVTSANAKTEITYGKPQMFTEVSPLKNWVVTQLKETDTALGQERVKDVTTKDAVYDYKQREFRGHKSVEVYEGGHLRYHGEWFKTDEFDFGKTERQTTSDSASPETPAREVVTDWEPKDYPSTGGMRKWVRPNWVRTTVNDYLSSPATTQLAYTYAEFEGGFGMVETVTRSGWTSGTSDDDRITEYEYWIRSNTAAPPSSSNPLLVRTRSERVQDGAHLGTPVYESQAAYYYDTPYPGGFPTRGSLVETRIWRGDASWASTLTDYDNHGRLTQKTDPDGVETNYAYHDTGGSFRPFISAETNELDLKIYRVYHRNYHGLSGKARTVCGPQHVGSPETDNCTQTEYDACGRPVQVWHNMGVGSEPLGLVQEFSYSFDELGQSPAFASETRDPDPWLHTQPPRISTTFFNRWGEVIQEQQTDDTRPCTAQHFEYDSLGRLYRAWLPYGKNSYQYEPPPSSAYYEYDHDTLDRQKYSLHTNGDEVSIAYSGPETRVTDERGNVTTYTDTGFGEVASISRTVAGQSLTSSYLYDAAGRLSQATDEEGGLYVHVYYKDGTLKSASAPDWKYKAYERTMAGRPYLITDSADSQVSYDYDGLGRPIDRAVTKTGWCGASTTTQHLEYDGQTRNYGRLTQVTGNLFTKVLDYDAQGHVTSKQLQSGSQTLSSNTDWSPFGEPLRVTYPSGRVVELTYDPAGGLSYIQESNRSNLFVSIHNTADGRPSSMQGWLEGSGRVDFSRNYSYDTKKRPTGIVSDVGGTLWDVAYTYWPNNLIHTATDSVRGFSYTYDYDPANRLSSATGYSVGNISYQYLKNGALDRVTTGSSVEQYRYNGMANQRLFSIQSPGTSTYLSQTGFGQTCQISKHQGLLPTSSRSYTWHGDGNLASVIETAVGQPQVTVTYDYDEAGQRFRRVSGTETTLYLDDLAELRNQTLIEYVSIPQARFELRTDQPNRVYFSDLLSTAMVVDDSGAREHLSTYLPYGKKTVIQPSSPDSTFDFNNKRREPGLGLLFYGARYYDPETRYFISPDPSRFEGLDDVVERGNLLNPFVYAAANPTSYKENGNAPIWLGAAMAGFPPIVTPTAQRAAQDALYFITPGADALHGILFGRTYWEARAGAEPSGNRGTYAVRWLGEVALAYATAGAVRGSAPQPKPVAPATVAETQTLQKAGTGTQAATQAARGASSFGAKSLGAAEVKILQTGRNTITGGTAKALNEATGMNLARREWGRALEALKHNNGLPAGHHGKITALGDYMDAAGKFIDNLLGYVP